MKQGKGSVLAFGKRAWVVLVLLAGLGASGCVSGARGTFNAQGYSSSYGYAVAPLAGQQQLLSSSWRLDNYANDGGKLRPKSGPEYSLGYEFDLNGDGLFEDQMQLQAYALRFKHLVNAGAIWVRDVPMEPDLRHKDLRVLMQSFIEEMSGTNYELVQLAGGRADVIRSREYSARVLAEGRATLAGRPAYFASLEIRNSNLQDSAADTRSRLVELVLVRAPNDELAGEQPKAKDNGGYPVLVVAGYSNMAEDYAEGLKDFHDLLGRLQIEGASGLVMEAPSAPAQAPVAVPAAAPPSAPTAAPTTTPVAAPPPAPRS